MGFKTRKGKMLSENDVKNLKVVYKDLFEGYLKIVAADANATLNTDYGDPGAKKYQDLCNDFLNRFEESSKSDEDIILEDFYDNGVLGIYSEWAQDPEMRKNDYFKDFAKRFGPHFEDRYQSNDITNKDSGLEASMKSFKLASKPIDGVGLINEFDPKAEYNDAFVEARQANSTTYGGLMLSEDKAQIQKATDDFKEIAKYSQNTAAKWQDKETIDFGDIYEAFSHINESLLVDEDRATGHHDGGKVRVNDIGAGKGADGLDGINSVAIPADLFTTLNTVADYMNQIKKTEDKDLQKSQAIQLAAFAYQLTISEHVFGNGNGRSCRFLADTILQTFGLPPQVPTFSLARTGATIGNKLDFEKGTRSIMRGLMLSSDLMRLNENKEIPYVEQKAKAYLDVEHLSPRILKATTPANAVNLAIQAGETKYSLSAYLDDFIKADHFGARNSKQYNGVIETMKKTLNILSSEAINSKKAAKALENMSKAIDDYEKHCERHPKNDSTRKSRLSAIQNIKKSIINAKDVAGLISDVEAVPFKNELAETKSQIAEAVTDDILKNGCKDQGNREMIGKYVLSDFLIKEIDRPEQPDRVKINFDDAMKFSEDSAQIEKIISGDAIDKAVEKLLNEPSFSEKSMIEKLDKIAENFVSIKIKEIADNKNLEPKEKVESVEKAGKDNKPAVQEEDTILTFMQ